MRFRIARKLTCLSPVVALAFIGSITSWGVLQPHQLPPAPRLAVVREVPYRTIALIVPASRHLVRSAKHLPTGLPPGTLAPPDSPPSTLPPVTPVMVDGVPAPVFAAWSKVNVCEEGGSWAASGPAYPDGLGISARNWVAYGGGTNLSPAAQIAVAQRIEAAAGTPGYVPDQGGCAAW